VNGVNGTFVQYPITKRPSVKSHWILCNIYSIVWYFVLTVCERTYWGSIAMCFTCISPYASGLSYVQHSEKGYR